MTKVVLFGDSLMLKMFVTTHQKLQDDQANFLGIRPHKVPFVLGIAGSVAVGKSTTARLLKKSKKSLT